MYSSNDLNNLSKLNSTVQKYTAQVRGTRFEMLDWILAPCTNCILKALWKHKIHLEMSSFFCICKDSSGTPNYCVETEDSSLLSFLLKLLYIQTLTCIKLLYVQTQKFKNLNRHRVYILFKKLQKFLLCVIGDTKVHTKTSSLSNLSVGKSHEDI